MEGAGPAVTKLTDEQKTALRTELAEVTARRTIHNPSLEQARDLGRLCKDFIAAQEKSLALPVSPSQKYRPTARAHATHDALREQIIALAVEFVTAEHLADLICKALNDDAPAEPAGQASLPFGEGGSS
jgi:hypothetical protein